MSVVSKTRSPRGVVLAIATATAIAAAGVAYAAPVRTGLASWYGAWHEGRTMSNGCPFRAGRLTAASRTVPIGAWVRVRKYKSDRAVVVEITDRGPYVQGRIIDMSRKAAEALDMIAAGIVMVSVEPLPSRNPLPAYGKAPCH